MKWYNASKLGYYYNKMSLTNHVYIVIYLLFSFLITNIQSITPSSVDNIHLKFLYQNANNNNHYIYNAGYCSKNPQDDVIYAKYNLVYKRVPTLIYAKVDKCYYGSSSNFPEIFQYKTNIIQTKLMGKLVDDSFEYIVNIGLCLVSSSDPPGQGTGIPITTDGKIQFNYPNIKCPVADINNNIGYVTITFQKSGSQYKASCSNDSDGKSETNLYTDNSLI